MELHLHLHLNLDLDLSRNLIFNHGPKLQPQFRFQLQSILCPGHTSHVPTTVLLPCLGGPKLNVAKSREQAKLLNFDQTSASTSCLLTKTDAANTTWLIVSAPNASPLTGTVSPWPCGPHISFLSIPFLLLLLLSLDYRLRFTDTRRQPMVAHKTSRIPTGT